MHANPDLSESPSETFLTHDEPPRQESNQSPPGCQANDDAPDPGLSLPPTLETRRKKIDTAAVEREAPSLSAHQIPEVDLLQPARPGAKRKFSPDDDGLLSDPAPGDDEFQFSRPSHSPQKLSDPSETLRQDLSPSKTSSGTKREPTRRETTKRKVLEPSMYQHIVPSCGTTWELQLTFQNRECQHQFKLTEEGSSRFESG